MKFCKDCKWAQNVDGPRYMVCSAPQAAIVTDLVTGEVKRRFKYCESYRSAPSGGPDDCGSEGLFWEPLDTANPTPAKQE
jgi:hypothetical protein